MAADLTNDGKLDLVVTSSALNVVYVMLGNGDGTFQTAHYFGAEMNPSSVVVGDFNGDGIPDLAVSNSGYQGSVSVLLGNGDGTFQPAQDYAVGSYPQSLLVEDFNRDGNLDLAVLNTSSNSISVLLGNGDGTFQPKEDYLVGPYPSSLAMGDFNGDGYPDLVAASPGSNSVSVMINRADWPASKGRIIFHQPPTATPLHIWQISSFRHADDFTLASPSQLTAIEFWAVGNPDFLSAFSGTVSWAIYDDASGLPGTVLLSGISSSTATLDTGIPNFFGDRYDVIFDLESPVALEANTKYWLEIHEGPTLTSNDGTEILWVSGTANADSPFVERQLNGGNWALRDEQLAFRLYGNQMGSGAARPPTPTFHRSIPSQALIEPVPTRPGSSNAQVHDQYTVTFMDLPPNPVQLPLVIWETPGPAQPEPAQRPKLIGTARHAQDAGFERWSDPVVGVSPWNLLW
jgi:hypothetical protein